VKRAYVCVVEQEDLFDLFCFLLELEVPVLSLGEPGEFCLVVEQVELDGAAVVFEVFGAVHLAVEQAV